MKTATLKKIISIFVSGLLAVSSAYAQGEVEVLHYWTSTSEAKAVAELRKLLEREGYRWKDLAVAGGAGENAMTVLKNRVLSGNPPSAAQVKGPAIQNWGDTGMLANIDAVAKANNWNRLIPKVIANMMKYKGHYVAVPVNVHRVNWLWINKPIFDKLGLKPPRTWDEFFAAADKIQKAGYLPIAHGGQAWQDATVFESIVLAVSDSKARLYKKAFIDLSPKALGSEDMQKAFEIFRKYQQLVDANAAGRDWDMATAKVIEGEAAMQIMGDWAKGEFTAAGQKLEEDYECVPVPGTAHTYTFDVDSFILFKQSNSDNKKAQEAFARLIMEPEFQTAFTLNKGSVPIRSGVYTSEFDSCARLSMEDFAQTARKKTLVPSMAHGMAVFPDAQSAIYDTITNFFNSAQSAEDATKALVQAVKSAQQ